MKQALIFPGQGAQYPGMGKDFYANYAEAKEVFDRADDLLGRHLSKLMFEGPEEELTKTENSQLAIFVMSMAIWSVVKPEAAVCAGLSLGEYSALAASGRISFEDALALVRSRGHYMQQACEQNKGTMSVVLGLPDALVSQVIHELQEAGERVWVANLNCPRQVVLAGTESGIAAAEAPLKAKGAKRYMPLQVSGAFHSELMAPAKEKLSPQIASVGLSDSDVAFVMNVPGNFVNTQDEIRAFLIDQVVKPVHWEKGIHAIETLGVERYMEMGPGKTLAGMNRKIGVNCPTVSIEKVEDLDAVT